MENLGKELAIGKSIVVGAARGTLGVGGAEVNILGIKQVKAPTTREAQVLLGYTVKQTKELLNYLPPILLESYRTKEFLSEEDKKELVSV